MSHTVTTAQPAQARSDVQPQRKATRALIPAGRAGGYREQIVDVDDTGRRRTRWMPAGSSDGRERLSYVEALVRVPGERDPWWIDAERLEPEGWDAQIAWLRMADDTRPTVVRREDGRGIGVGGGARVAAMPRRSRRAAC